MDLEFNVLKLRHIPVKEAEDYIIKMADKNREEKEIKEVNRDILGLRKLFWSELLEKFNSMSNLYKNVSPSPDSWISKGSGMSGIGLNFVVTKSYAGVELYIGKFDKECNKKIFDALYENKDEIEKDYGTPLIWQRLENKKASRITERLNGVDITNKEDWERMKEFLCDSMIRFEKALREPLKKASTL